MRLHWASLAVAVGMLAPPGADAPGADIPLLAGRPWVGNLSPQNATRFRISRLAAGETYAVSVALLAGDVRNDERIAASFAGPCGEPIQKELHAGDPSVYFQFRCDTAGPATLSLSGNAKNARDLPVRVLIETLGVSAAGRAAFEAEPNDTWQQANPLVLGRTVYGSADDVDYLESRYEGRTGLDWFRIDFAQDEPRLVFFELDLLDRDMSPNLKLYRLNEQPQELAYYTAGKDPMELLADDDDSDVRQAAVNLLRAAGWNPSQLEPDARLEKENAPDFYFFKERERCRPEPDPAQAAQPLWPGRSQQ